MNSALRDAAILGASWRISGSSSSARRHVARNIGKRPHQPHLLIGREHAPVAPGRDSKAGKRRQLAGERLGGSHADFRACERRQYDLTRARHCRAWHVDNRKDALPVSFGEFQRGERVGGLSGLRYKDRQISGIKRHVAVAKFGRDIDFHRQPGVTLEPVPGNQPGVKGRATGRDRHSIDIAKIQFHVSRHFDRAAGDINVLCERLADHPRLFVNFFEHKVPMLAFLDQHGRADDFGWRASQVFALGIEKVNSLPRDDSDVTVFQVADHVGKWRKSNRVRPKVHFASAIPDRKWRSFARSNYQIFVAFKQERKCKRSFQPRQRSPYCIDWARILSSAVGLRDERSPRCLCR